ncbi:MAG: hypothetical protein C4345_11165, partial [Chloroflexota bacterium]
MRTPHQLGAELVGTFGLVFEGTGAIIVDHQTGAVGHSGVAIIFGLVVMIMVYAPGHLSGAHLNPAVTLAFASTQHLPRSRAAGYVIATHGCAACQRAPQAADRFSREPRRSPSPRLRWPLVLA